MATSMRGLWFHFLLGILVIATANRPAAGSLVTVNFTGSGTGPYTGTTFYWGLSLRSVSEVDKRRIQIHRQWVSLRRVVQVSIRNTPAANDSQSDPFQITTTSGHIHASRPTIRKHRLRPLLRLSCPVRPSA